MTLVLDFAVPGLPQQQGSKNPYGGESNKNLKPWRAEVKAAAQEAFGDQPLIREQPVLLSVQFSYPRPKAHYRTGRNAHRLRGDAPYLKRSAPDLDKLLRAVGDSLTGVVIHDDALIAEVTARKVYAERASTRISLWTVPHVVPDEVDVGGVGGPKLHLCVQDGVGPGPPDVPSEPPPHPVAVAPFAAHDVRVPVQSTVAPGRS